VLVHSPQQLNLWYNVIYGFGGYKMEVPVTGNFYSNTAFLKTIYVFLYLYF